MRIRTLLASAIAVAAVADARADTYTWVGTTTDWGDPNNWTSSTVPGANDVALFAGMGSTSVILDTDRSIGQIQFASGAQAYTISGAPTFTFNSVGAISLLNASTAAQTISTNVFLNTTGNYNLLAGSTTTLSGQINGSASDGMNLNGTGVMQFSGAAQNINQGKVTVGNGITLQVLSNEKLSEVGSVGLSGGTLSLGTTTDTDAGVLSFDANSTVALGGFGYTYFDNITSIGGTILNITGWTGTAGAVGGGTGHTIYAAGGVPSLATLANIQFAGFSQGAFQLASGEIVPVPEPATTLAVAALGVVGFRKLRRRPTTPVGVAV